MNYLKIYESLISRGKTQRDLEYSERHHIIPKCMGGTDDEGNIAILSAAEHYIAHLLLVKIYPGNDKLVFSAKMMQCSNNYSKSRATNKSHEWLRKLHSEALKGRVFSDETKAKMSASALVKERVKCSHCDKVGLVGNMRRWHFDNCKHGPTPKIVKHTEEYKANMRKVFAIKKPVKNSKVIKCDWCDYEGIQCVVNARHNDYCKHNPNRKFAVLKTVVCPHCGKEGTISNMRRWHFDNCKHKSI